MIRTHQAGSLREANAGQTVTLAGWIASRRDHGGVAFLDLRDASGRVQVVVREPEVAHPLRDEFCIKVTGEVSIRPEGNENPELATGAIEVIADELTVLSTAAPLPFPIDDRVNVGDEVRLRHRYLDLRRTKPGDALRMRSRVNQVARDVLLARDFVEVETPTLTRSTPEGARDFLVPVRLQPGHWYALPQSPQLFKQLLMVGGIERYFQIARCYRDEDFRADRQPEFTQLDIEMSFVDQEDVIDVGEAVVRALWQELAGHTIGEIPRLTYAEAMRRFGTDKPDLRYGLELADLSEVLAGTGAAVLAGALADGGSVVALAVPAGEPLTRRELDGWVDWAKARGAGGLAWGVVEDGESGVPTLRSPLAKFLRPDEIAGILSACAAATGDTVLFAAGPTDATRTLMGALRVALAADRGLVPDGAWRFLWVTEPPMFDAETDRAGRPTGGWVPNHHPFTAPGEAFVDTFDTDQGSATSRAYDIVLNGVELASGSIRIHDAELQRRVFRFLGISDEEAEAKFGFLLRGLSHGVPPHGGIAPGIDRTIMLMAGEDSIREVIAFPKTQSGACPLTDAPAPYDEAALTELGLRLLPAPPKGA